jgi:hypothetical protein
MKFYHVYNINLWHVLNVLKMLLELPLSLIRSRQLCRFFSPGLPVRIEGFSNDSNCIRGKALSQARAQLVKDCLLKSGCTKLGSGGDFPKGRWR